LTNLAIAFSFNNISTFREFSKRFERSKAIERLERLEPSDLHDERSEAVEGLERLELAPSRFGANTRGEIDADIR
jgi:hypothetical protein